MNIPYSEDHTRRLYEELQSGDFLLVVVFILFF
jgi:hypothetical protein